jgi:hypothetical protein
MDFPGDVELHSGGSMDTGSRVYTISDVHCSTKRRTNVSLRYSDGFQVAKREAQVPVYQKGGLCL